MKILILGATGMVGQSYVVEALERGHDVIACARTPKSSFISNANLVFEKLDVLNEEARLKKLVSDCDIVVSALRPVDGEEEMLIGMTRIVLETAQNLRKRVYVTGGAAPLKLSDGSGYTVLNAPNFLPESVRPIAEACQRQDDLFEEFKLSDWICLRPAALLIEGQRTKRYALGRDCLVTQADGVSRISYADFAVAMFDLIELCVGVRQRLTVGW